MDTLKPNAIRLLDVFAIGPVMMVAAARLPKRDRALGLVLGAFGLTTILYNARNYLLRIESDG
jgi:hypothetical protein